MPTKNTPSEQKSEERSVKKIKIMCHGAPDRNDPLIIDIMDLVHEEAYELYIQNFRSRHRYLWDVPVIPHRM